MKKNPKHTEPIAVEADYQNQNFRETTANFTTFIELIILDKLVILFNESDIP